MSRPTLSLDALYPPETAADDAAARIAAATAAVIAPLGATGLDALGGGNPGYVGFDWAAYLRASQRRIRLLHELLATRLPGPARILDQGALLGNFSLSLNQFGHTVTACDAYGEHEECLRPWMRLLRGAGVAVVDCDMSRDPLPFPDQAFDCVIAMGVIEHIPHTPRLFLIELARVLRPGGLLVIETPNLAYQARREALAAGRSVFQDLTSQFWCQPPFTGHHREYTAHELAWMLGQVGLACEQVFSFDFSCHALTDPADRAWRQHLERVAAPELQEVLMAIGRKPAPGDREPPQEAPSRGDAAAPAAFDMEASRTYWRFAPSGLGKHDTSELLAFKDAEILTLWTAAFTARARTYFEECLFLQTLAPTVRGKRVLSIGSGMGFHELFFAANGAEVICYDIVASNLTVIKRIANLKGLPIRTRVVAGIDSYEEAHGTYDILYIYGSLMTMPESEQRALLARVVPFLKPDGELILMLYTPKFAEDTCGSASPQAFARHSDPSVGSLDCPWSDWHDDAKVLRLAGGGMEIARRQLWNHDWFSWHGLRRSSQATSAQPGPFFDLGGSDPGAVVVALALDGFEPGAATLTPWGPGLRIATTANQFLYAALSRPFPALAQDGLAVQVDLEILEGACSIGLLQLPRDEMVVAQAIHGSGRRRLLFPIPGTAADGTMRLVVSNFAAAAPAISVILLHAANVVRFPLPAIPDAALP